MRFVSGLDRFVHRHVHLDSAPPLARRLARAALVSLLCLSCGDDDPAKPASGSGQTGEVKKAVGPGGDTITVGGAVVTFPEGALDKTVEVTITATDDPPPAEFEAISKVFKCEPSGTDFLKPVTMKMPFSDDGKPASMFWTSGADPTFKELADSKKEGATMTATVKHFSAGFVGRKKAAAPQ